MVLSHFKIHILLQTRVKEDVLDELQGLFAFIQCSNHLSASFKVKRYIYRIIGVCTTMKVCSFQTSKKYRSIRDIVCIGDEIELTTSDGKSIVNDGETILGECC